MAINRKVRVGIIGCGNISGAYFKGCANFDILDVVACADINMAAAETKAEAYGVRACRVDDILADSTIDLIINLTVPLAHADVTCLILESGKHAYCEKPLAVHRADGQRVLALAEEKDLRLGCAPDTFLGGGIQTCRKLIDDGWIGQPIAATAFMMGHGPEDWHPNPDFFYKIGGGPMLDMGPYYLTALINLLGPVKRLCGSAQKSFPERVIGNRQNRYGETIPVDVPTHVSGVLDFASGAVGTMVISFDIWGSQLPRLEIYGSTGTLVVPDPNTFGGPVLLLQAHSRDWNKIPLTHSSEVGRGIGVADLASAILTGRAHRVNGHLAYHVLDLMHTFFDSSNSGKHILIESTCEQPAPLPLGLMAGQLD